MISMKLENLYKNKLVSSDEAVSKIKNDDNVVFGQGRGEPLFPLHSLIKDKEKYKNLGLYNMIPMSQSEYAEEGVEKYIHIIALKWIIFKIYRKLLF